MLLSTEFCLEVSSKASRALELQIDASVNEFLIEMTSRASRALELPNRCFRQYVSVTKCLLGHPELQNFQTDAFVNRILNRNDSWGIPERSGGQIANFRRRAPSELLQNSIKFVSGLPPSSLGAPPDFIQISFKAPAGLTESIVRDPS